MLDQYSSTYLFYVEWMATGRPILPHLTAISPINSILRVMTNVQDANLGFSTAFSHSIPNEILESRQNPFPYTHSDFWATFRVVANDFFPPFVFVEKSRTKTRLTLQIKCCRNQFPSRQRMKTYFHGITRRASAKTVFEGMPESPFTSISRSLNALVCAISRSIKRRAISALVIVLRFVFRVFGWATFDIQGLVKNFWPEVWAKTVFGDNVIKGH